MGLQDKTILPPLTLVGKELSLFTVVLSPTAADVPVVPVENAEYATPDQPHCLDSIHSLANQMLVFVPLCL